MYGKELPSYLSFGSAILAKQKPFLACYIEKRQKVVMILHFYKAILAQMLIKKARSDESLGDACMKPESLVITVPLVPILVWLGTHLSFISIVQGMTMTKLPGMLVSIRNHNSTCISCTKIKKRVGVVWYKKSLRSWGHEERGLVKTP